MQELKDIKKDLNPNEILFTIDAMMGQDSVNVAKEFNDQLDVTGIIITKLDGDTRGGVALSVKAVTGKQVLWCRRKGRRYRTILSRPYGQPYPWYG